MVGTDGLCEEFAAEPTLSTIHAGPVLPPIVQFPTMRRVSSRETFTARPRFPPHGGMSSVDLNSKVFPDNFPSNLARHRVPGVKASDMPLTDPDFGSISVNMYRQGQT